jgi:hypothetical protein
VPGAGGLPNSRWIRLLWRRQTAVAALALPAAYLTTRMPIVTVVRLLVALDIGVWIYWLYVRPRRDAAAAGHARAPLRLLAKMITTAGVVLIVTALWLTMLGVLSQFDIIDRNRANWNALAASGFQVNPDQPAVFGARSLVVAAAVWMVGFGLAKAAGEKA